MVIIIAWAIIGIDININIVIIFSS